MNKFTSLLRSSVCGCLGLVFLAVLSGCGPRGETRTLDQVFASAKKDYAKASGANLQQDVAVALADITKAMQELVDNTTPETVNNRAPHIADGLSQLIGRSGYTSRPALGELISQYRTLPVAEQNISAGQVKLLTARTYTLLATELRTTKFEVH